MNTTTTKPEAFGTLLAALREVYETEIARLADLYRPRILAGEFSGDRPNDAGVRVQDLEEELARVHPWAQTFELAMVVIGVSPWTRTSSGECTVEISSARVARSSAGECLAHDVLAAATRRGWIRFARDPYPVRRAAAGAA